MSNLDKDQYKQLEDKYNRLMSANGTLADTDTTMVIPYRARDLAPTAGMSLPSHVHARFEQVSYLRNAQAAMMLCRPWLP